MEFCDCELSDTFCFGIGEFLEKWELVAPNSELCFDRTRMDLILSLSARGRNAYQNHRGSLKVVGISMINHY